MGLLYHSAKARGTDVKQIFVPRQVSLRRLQVTPLVHGADPQVLFGGLALIGAVQHIFESMVLEVQL